MAKQDFSLIKDIKDFFPESSWSWAIPGLRREPLIWETLRDEHFFDQACQDIGAHPEKWTPARLGVIAVNRNGSESIPWPLPPFGDLSPEIRQRVYQAYQDFSPHSDPISRLDQALHLALGMLQEKQAGKTWDELLGDTAAPSAWQAALVCIYEMLDAPTGLMKALPDTLGLHIVLARPTPPPATRERLRGHISLFSRSKQLAWLDLLADERPETSYQLAKTLTTTPPSLPESMTDMLGESRLYHAAGDPHSALQLLKKASSLHEQLKGTLAAHINATQAKVEAPQLSSPAWKDILHTVSDPLRLEKHADEVAALLDTLIEKKFFAAAENMTEELSATLPDHPPLLSTLAKYALEAEEPEKAHQLALRALDVCGEEDIAAPAALSEVFLSLNLFEEAIQAAKSTLTMHPDHQKTLVTLAQAEDEVGDHDHAVEHAQLAVLFQPQEVPLRRQFAAYLEHAQKWEEALQERSRVLAELQGDSEGKSTFTPTLPKSDMQALANCAYQANQPSRAVKVCENLIEQDPDDGLAHTTLGKSLRALGKEEEGIRHLEKAADTAPELPDPWLALSECYMEKGDTERAIQTLSMGTNAADRSAKLYLALGKIHNALQAPSQALEAFQKSSRLAEEEGVDQQTEHEIGYQLGKAYYELGHLTEARDTLRQLKARYPGNQKTNYIYGKVLLDMDEPRGALPYLAQVVDAQPQDAEPYLHYADAHLRIGANPKIAIKSLHQALERKPQDDKAQALLAEAFEANGEYERALDHFRHSLDSSLSQDPVWGPRITIGLGKTALNLGQTETALATLNEGLSKNPRNLALAQMLAKAYAEAELRNDALSTAQKALDIAPDDIENLTWVSDFTLELDSPRHAIPALEELINLNPDEAASYIKLGKAQRLSGNPEQAKVTFAKIAALDHAAPEGLFQAGDELLHLGDMEEGMRCLERAAHVSQSNTASNDLLPKIWARMAEGQAMNGNEDRALELLDQAIEADLNQPTWRIKKADLLLAAERYQAALASLKNALDLNPENPALHYKLARAYRQVSEYKAAFNHAQQAYDLNRAQPEIDQDQLLRSVSLAAELASATLQPDIAYKTLMEHRDALSSQLSEGSEHVILASCQLAEIMLDRDQEADSASFLEKVRESEFDHPRMNALRARCLARQGDVLQAESILDPLKAQLEDDSPAGMMSLTSTYLALAVAHRDIERWDDAVYYFRKAALHAPQEPRTRYHHLRAIVQRAEAQRFAQALKVINHTPGERATNQEAKKVFSEALAALKALGVEANLSRKWELRGMTIFQPSPQTTDALEEFAQDRDDLAALLASLRHQHQLDQAAKRAIGNFDKLGGDEVFDAQVALSILQINPTKALEAARSAYKNSQAHFNLTAPMFAALKALAADSAGDSGLAYDSMVEALETWDDEPRWHALAAEFCQNPDDAIDHLEWAVDLEPEYAGHYLNLGEAYLRFNEPQAALAAFDEVVSLTPEQVEAWIGLARCQRKLGRTDQALESARQSVNISPDHARARTLLAEIALQNKELQLAETHLKHLINHGNRDPQVYALLSQTLAAQKQPQEALAVIDKAVALSGDALDLKLQRVDLIKETDGKTAAVDALRVIGSHHPDDYRVIHALVNALAESGETDQAISTAKTILSKDDVGHTSQQKASLHLLTGRLLRKSGQLDQAVHHFHEVKKLDPQTHEAYLELGRTHLERRQFDRALERLNKAIDLAPDNAMSYFYAGKVLKELKEYDRAERMLRQASKLAPNDLRIHRQLGVLVTLNLVHGDRKKESAYS